MTATKCGLQDIMKRHIVKVANFCEHRGVTPSGSAKDIKRSLVCVTDSSDKPVGNNNGNVFLDLDVFEGYKQVMPFAPEAQRENLAQVSAKGEDHAQLDIEALPVSVLKDSWDEVPQQGPGSWQQRLTRERTK